MLNEQGGVIVDLIVYFLCEDFFRVVVNAATHYKDLAWIEKQAKAFDVKVTERADLSMIAVQGPNARAKVQSLLTPEVREKAARIGKFVAVEGDGLFIARTGYTGEDGYEIIVPETQTVSLWNRLKDAGVAPAGLGARDTLRLEAGMNLYGQDMDETITPWEAGLAWTVSLEPGRAFIGRGPLEEQKTKGAGRILVGLVLDDKGVLRHGQSVATANLATARSSPARSRRRWARPSRSARVPSGTTDKAEVDIRGKLVPVRVVKYPFVRDGKRLRRRSTDLSLCLGRKGRVLKVASAALTYPPCFTQQPAPRIQDMNEVFPATWKFLKSHEWARIEDNGTAYRAGISDHAQEPARRSGLRRTVRLRPAIRSRSATRAPSSSRSRRRRTYYTPVSGEVVAVNAALGDKPETINEDAYGEGWIFVIKPSNLAEEQEELLDPDAYAEAIEDEEH